MRPAGLRDIHDLMRGTGLGADAGVVIESRMIDALLSDRPDDRRELFEEASGIGLYRDRRRTTERRLEETAIDLARLDDLLSEVQTQVRSLARQRRRAERYAELTTRRFAVEVTLAIAISRPPRRDGRLDAAAGLRRRVPRARAVAMKPKGSVKPPTASEPPRKCRRAEFARVVATLHHQVSALQGEIAVAESDNTTHKPVDNAPTMNAATARRLARGCSRSWTLPRSSAGRGGRRGGCDRSPGRSRGTERSRPAKH